jgi:predicted dehydrogenase
MGQGAVEKVENPVRIGVLGASQVATYALIWPAKRLPDVEVAAVAARDATRAKEYAKKHGIPMSYGSYQELLEDPTLTAIYVATPNGLHGDWAAAALKAGKHVLCEKPFTANAGEAKSVQSVASKRKLLCREAFHYKEHPANKAVAHMLQSGAIGDLKQLNVQVLVPSWAFNKNDIRFQFKLAGGTMMDAGCYCAHTLRFFPGCSRPKVVSATAGKLVDNGRVDGHMTAVISYPASCGAAVGAVGKLEADLRHGGLWPQTRFTAVGTRGRLEMDNFIMPFMGHTLSITRALPDVTSPSNKCDSIGGELREREQKLAVYGSNESNYYYQLRRFITDLQVLEDKQASKQCRRAVRDAMTADADDAIDNMTLIDSIYKAASLPVREPTSTFVSSKAEAKQLVPASKSSK